MCKLTFNVLVKVPWQVV